MCWSLFLIKLQALKKETSIPVIIAKYYNSFFYETPPVASFVSLINCSMMGICGSSFNQKQNKWDGFY